MFASEEKSGDGEWGGIRCGEGIGNWNYEGVGFPFLIYPPMRGGNGGQNSQHR